MSHDQPHQYKLFLEDDQLLRLSQLVSPRVKEFFEAIQIPLKDLTRDGIQGSYTLILGCVFGRLQYATEAKEGPICWKKTNRFYMCFDCTIYTRLPSCFCVSCFVPKKHQGHNFRYIESKEVDCVCGDHSFLEPRSFCAVHSKKVKEEVSIELEKKFIREIQFAVYLFLKITQIKGKFMDDSKKKEAIGIALITHLIKLGKGNYVNRILITRLLSSRFLDIFPDLTSEERESSILALLAKKDTYSAFVENFAELISMLYPIQDMKKLVITELFTSLTSKNRYFNEKNMLSKVWRVYTNSKEIINQTIKDFPDFTIKYQFTDYASKVLNFYEYYKIIAFLANDVQFAQAILERTNIVEMANHYIPNAEKSHPKEFYILEMDFFHMAAEMMICIVTSTKKDKLLEKIISDCFAYLKAKSPSPCRSVQRIVGLACFIHLQYNVENIYYYDAEHFLTLFGEVDEDQLIKLLNKLICNIFPALKYENNSEEYKTDLSRRNDSQRALLFNLHMSCDHIFTKILVSILLKLQQPSILESTFEPLEKFLHSRNHAIKVLVDLYKSEQIARLEDTIGAIVFEISSIVKYFIFLSETDLYQLIIQDYLKFGSNKRGLFDLFEFLIYIEQPQSIKSFRDEAGRFLHNNEILMQFVQGSYERYKKDTQNGVVPQNNFNISFGSHYLGMKSEKEYKLMYSLKLNKYKRTEISRYIFSYEMLDRLKELYGMIFSIYENNFKENHVKISQTYFTFAIETLLLLFLETKDDRFSQILEKVISSEFMAHNNLEYYRCLVRLFKQNRKPVMEQTIKASGRSLEEQKKLREKVATKMNQMKNKQADILKKTLSTQTDKFDAQSPSKLCIICMDPKKEERMFYFSHARMTNFAKTNQKYNPNGKEDNMAYLLLSTCGHCAHASCISKNIEGEQDIFSCDFEWDCFLCKQNFNHLFPVFTQYQQMTQDEHNRYVSYLMMFMEDQLEELRGESKEYFKKIIDKGDWQRVIFQFASKAIELYSWQFPKYFICKLMPIIKEAIHILHKMINMDSNSKKNARFSESQSKYQGAVPQLISRNLAYCVEMNSQKERAKLKDKVAEVFEEYSNETDGGYDKEYMDRLYLIFKEFSSFSFIDTKELTLNYSIKDSFSNFYQLPSDLVELNKEIGLCPTCNFATSKMLICFLCSFKTCIKCANRIKKHVSYHAESCVFVMAELGECLFYHKEEKYFTNSLYENYAGEALENQMTFPVLQKYRLSQVKKMELYETVLEDRVQDEIDESAAQNTCQIQ